MQQFTGTVVFAADPEPYDAGYGPSFNIKVKIDQPNAPKTDGDNEATIYKSANSPEAAYMRTLRPGDPITLVTQKGKSGNIYYQIVEPADSQARTAHIAQPAQQQAQSQVVSRHTPEIPQTWSNPGRDEEQAWLGIAEWNVGRLMQVLVHTMATAESMGADISVSDALSIARAAAHRAHVEWRPGMTLGDGTEKSVIDKIVGEVNPADPANTLLLAICKYDEFYDSTKTVVGVLKEFGLSSDDVADEDSWRMIAGVALDFAEAINDGAEANVAVSFISEKYGIKHDETLPW